MARPCVCGHPEAAHRHYRSGAECALCEPSTCPRYRAPIAHLWWRAIAPARPWRPRRWPIGRWVAGRWAGGRPADVAGEAEHP